MSGTAAPGPGIVLVDPTGASALPDVPRGTSARPQPIVIDCDPGHDDAVAILLALARPDLDVLGISTVGGNAVLERTTETALRVLALAGRPDVEVAAGAAHPIDGPLHTAPHVHGDSGIEGPALPAPVSSAIGEFAPHAMARWIRGAEAPVVLVPTGPLTNVALLLEEHPDVRERIAHICLMGGSVTEGNITPAAEFNIWEDPEAAEIVFDAGIPLTMIGLDVTHRSIVWEREREAIARAGARRRGGRRAPRVLPGVPRAHVRLGRHADPRRRRGRARRGGRPGPDGGGRRADRDGTGPTPAAGPWRTCGA